MTAIEWLLEHDYLIMSTKWPDIVEQAKEMEKEQIIESHEQAYIKMNMSFSAADRAEDYYNETYGSKREG
jgi:hypothetical protein